MKKMCTPDVVVVPNLHGEVKVDEGAGGRDCHSRRMYVPYVGKGSECHMHNEYLITQTVIHVDEGRERAT